MQNKIIFKIVVAFLCKFESGEYFTQKHKQGNTNRLRDSTFFFQT